MVTGWWTYGQHTVMLLKVDIYIIIRSYLRRKDEKTMTYHYKSKQGTLTKLW